MDALPLIQGVEDSGQREHHVFTLGRRLGVRGDRDLDVRPERRPRQRSGGRTLPGGVHRTHREHVGRRWTFVPPDHVAVFIELAVVQIPDDMFRHPVGWQPLAIVDLVFVARGRVPGCGCLPGQRHHVIAGLGIESLRNARQRGIGHWLAGVDGTDIGAVAVGDRHGSDVRAEETR